MSRSFVGSSRSSTSAGSSISRAISTRACSPPESRPTGVSSCSARKRKRLAQPATWIGRPWKITESPCGRQRALSEHARDRGGRGAGRTSRSRRSAPARRVPASGARWPGEQAQQRRLAAAVGAQQARGACPGDSTRSRPRTTARPPNALRRPFATSRRFVLRSVAAKSMPTRPRARPRVQVGQLVPQPPGLVDARLRLARARLGLARQPLELAAHAVAQRLLVRRPGRPAARPSSPGTRCSARAPRAGPRRRRGSARARARPRPPGSSGRGSPPGRPRGSRCSSSSSQRMPSTSRWFVGSSRSSSSGSRASSRAMARRFFQPPESVDTAALASAKPALPITTAMRPSASWSSRWRAGRAPPQHLPHAWRPARTTGPGHVAEAQPPAHGARARCRAAPGPARIFRSVDLPEPFGPDEPDAVALEDAEGEPLEEGRAPNALPRSWQLSERAQPSGARPATRASFSARLNCLMRCSSRRASPHVSTWRDQPGRRAGGRECSARPSRWCWRRRPRDPWRRRCRASRRRSAGCTRKRSVLRREVAQLVAEVEVQFVGVRTTTRRQRPSWVGLVGT